MITWLKAYTRWLHTQWPAGKPERLPLASGDYSTNVPGVYVVGDLTGVPLLKLSANAGTDVVRYFADDRALRNRAAREDVLDVAIIGGGTAGFAAAVEAEKQGLRYCVFEASEPFSTIVNFPKAKPIYTYPTDVPLAGDLKLHEKSGVKEGLLEDLREQTVERGVTWAKGRVDHITRRGGMLELVIPEGIDTEEGRFDENIQPALAAGETVRAHRVIVAIGRSGNYRKLEVPGEERSKVYNRLHDPADFCHHDVLVVGGGDSALETAIALTRCGANVTLSYRRAEFSRAKPENIEAIHELAQNPTGPVDVEQPTDERMTVATAGYLAEKAVQGSLTLRMPTQVTEIRENDVALENERGEPETLPNDTVFTMIGREPPLDFFRKSGVRISGEWTWKSAIGPTLFLLVCLWVYHWKAPYAIPFGLSMPAWLNPDPSRLAGWLQSLGGAVGTWLSNPATLPGTIVQSMQGASFYYTFAYTLLIVIFGIKRIRYRRTPYVKVQTLTLGAIQVVPLFLLPEILLPWLAALGVFDSGVGLWLKEALFPGESWWRAYGLILAWPLMVYNWFTPEPIWAWLVIGFAQTFVLIPLMIRYWGKGAYCGWICSCGAMAETLGDKQRHKMPHGPGWNRLNMLGQAILALAILLMLFRIIGWAGVGWAQTVYQWGLSQAPLVNYQWFVDLLLAGVLGYGLYFFMSGRMWCRFACPLAALMHIYARFSQFRILADKKKCISCNVCTSVCHQGIDIMSFANKGEPMADPQCVRCSACVQMCPTGVLSFGRVDNTTGDVIAEDPSWLSASPVQMAELRVNGKPVKR